MNSKLTGFINSFGFKIILLIILIFAGYKTYLSMRQVHQLEQDINFLKEKIVLVEDENIQLKERIEKIDDPEYIEEIARKELGLVRQGELLLIPVDGDESPKQGDEETGKNEQTAKDLE